ncbi:DNA transposition protein [Pseudogulbenkiania sp. NH8B]|uniref:AAA family ATPase n=1 Tax=Pseudogulbenkiania sp. (strain NH8B) TaxID=748280 RepID=UPI0002279B39|nr:ATP-binding protein [Pseudogulbenkiania sp. NH8B]BAK76462.1 DNA transposition protein [Pseudogulbenkiania sp. NH8B]BAK76891.1 DNA transposition protein [Pseudogulbenkiania sp. NH8B]
MFDHSVNRIAPIANLDLVAVVMEKLVHRQDGLPGLAVYYGPSGWGKTTATVAVANRSRAYYVQMRSSWTRKDLLEKILFEMGIKPAGRTTLLLDQICEQLAASRRPLILDEFDYAADKHAMVELVRDIYEGSQSSLLLVGEELLPNKLKKYERFHGRVLSWVPAAPVNLDDVRKLAAIYCPEVALADDLLNHLVALSHGSVRRVSVNLVNVHDAALIEGWDSVDRAQWGERALYTGDAPKRRAMA